MVVVIISGSGAWNAIDIILTKEIFLISKCLKKYLVPCHLVISKSKFFNHMVKTMIYKVNVADVILIFFGVGVIFPVTAISIGIVLNPSGVFNFSFPCLYCFLVCNLILEFKDFLKLIG